MTGWEHTLSSLTGGPVLVSLARLLALGIVALLIARTWDRGLHIFVALRRPWARRLGARTGGIKLLLGFIVLLFAGQPALDADPESAAVLAGLGLALLTLWGRNEVLNVVSGLGLAVRAPFSLGDEVALGPHRGVVERVGLTRLRLRATDGSNLEVPCSLLATEKLVRPPKDAQSLPIVVVVEGPSNMVEDAAAAAMRDHALLSPYTDPDAPVLATPAGQGRLRIELTPIHSDEAAMLEGDLRSRAKLL